MNNIFGRDQENDDVLPESERDVHTDHCCLKHGCKYSDKDCTVRLGKKKQSYPCETCDYAKERMANIDKLYIVIQKLGFYHPEIRVHGTADTQKPVRVCVYADRETGTNFVDDGEDIEDAASKVLVSIKTHVTELLASLDDYNE
jgi:hypothetical protein